MRSALYRDLLRIAGRTARPQESEDIVQEALLAAVAVGRTSFDEPATRAWLAGTIRRRAAFAARSAVRRRRRETAWSVGRDDAAPMPERLEAVAEGLPPGLRPVLALVLTGHSRREIAYLLRLSDPALRQRISSLRRHLRAAGSLMPEEFVGLRSRLDHGRVRQALRPLVGEAGGYLASHDPDGHLFVISPSRNRMARQQSSEANPQETLP